jgi:hypothetical protein
MEPHDINPDKLVGEKAMTATYLLLIGTASDLSDSRISESVPTASCPKRGAISLGRAGRALPCYQ